MTSPLRYASKAKVAHAIAMARLAGIERIGAIEFGPDGTIRVSAETRPPAASAIEDDIAQWRERRKKGH